MRWDLVRQSIGDINKRQYLKTEGAGLGRTECAY